jgi:hypothetical protein
MIFDRFRKKKEEVQLPFETAANLPEDLERFRMRSPGDSLPEIRPAEIRSEPREEYPVPEMPYTKSVDDIVTEKTKGDKIELILQKLETIDARLRLLEERTKKY